MLADELKKTQQVENAAVSNTESRKRTPKFLLKNVQQKIYGVTAPGKELGRETLPRLLETPKNCPSKRHGNLLITLGGNESCYKLYWIASSMYQASFCQVSLDL